jgi:hypothetical protein
MKKLSFLFVAVILSMSVTAGAVDDEVMWCEQSETNDSATIPEECEWDLYHACMDNNMAFIQQACMTSMAFCCQEHAWSYLTGHYPHCWHAPWICEAIYVNVFSACMDGGICWGVYDACVSYSSVNVHNDCLTMAGCAE